MANRSLTKRQLSRSKLSLYLECPRCFFAEVVEDVPRVPSFPFTLNNAVDRLLKAEFDRHRLARTSHPLFATVGLDAVPFPHANLDDWRSNFKGIRWLDSDTEWTLFGAIDDVWSTAEQRLIVADYKATARADEVTVANVYASYRQQIESTSFFLPNRAMKLNRAAGSSTPMASQTCHRSMQRSHLGCRCSPAMETPGGF